MTTYDLETTDFALSNEGIHFLRNGYNFKTFTYPEIDQVVLKKGVEIKNPAITLLIGILLISFSLFQSKWVFDIFNKSKVHRIYIESIIVVLFPILLGIYCLIVAFKKGPILQVTHKKTAYKLRIKQLVRRNETDALKNYLKNRLQYKFLIEANNL